MSGVSRAAALSIGSRSPLLEAIDLAVAVEADIDDALLGVEQEGADLRRHGRSRILEVRARREHPFRAVRHGQRGLELRQGLDERRAEIEVAQRAVALVALIVVAAAAQPVID